VKLISLAALALLAGCAAMHDHQQGATDYCDEYRATMAGKSVEEKRKAAEAHIVRMHGSADAAHIERHMRMVEQRCGKAAG
jgi:uncharacterized protein YceK